MGHGICQLFAQTGKYNVTLRDVEQQFIDNGMKMITESLQRFVQKGSISQIESREILKRIHPTLDPNEAFQKADLIVEAVTEDPRVKKEVIIQADKLAQPHTIIASNTSTISITEIASVTRRPEKVCGMHFFNPPQLMKLIEIVRGKDTSSETVNVIERTAISLGKEPLIVNKDSPGFIVNRVLIPALNEASFLVENGVAKPEDVDKGCVLALNWPMGPLKLLDYIGIDTVVSIADVMVQRTGDQKFLPSPLLRRMVSENRLGRKTGKGFYDWAKRDDV